MPANAKAAARAKAKAKAAARKTERAMQQRARVRAAAKAKADKLKNREQKKVRNKLRRREAIRVLNTLAATVGVNELRGKDVPWQKVERLIGILDGRCQEDEQRVSLRDAAEKWVACGGQLTHGLSAPSSLSEDTTPAAIPHHKIIEKGFRIRTHAFMVTYNSSQITKQTWAPYEQWFRALARSLGAHAWAACLEESLHTSGAGPRYHLHGYLLWKGGDGFVRKNTDDLVFEYVRPRIDVCTRTNPMRLQTAALQGLYYVYIMKAGTVSTASNFQPWRDYTPKAEWIDAWWSGKKLTHAQYIDYSKEFRTGHAKRRRDWEEVVRSERDHAIDEHLRKEVAAIDRACPELPMRPNTIAQSFVDLFREPCRRRPVLAIVGGTNLGKSMLAAKVLGQVAELLELPGFLEVTVEGDSHMDLSEFDLRRHAGVLLDGIGDVLMLKQQRETLQGRAKKCRGGKSATMMYSYAFTLCRRAVVATLDLSAKNLHLLSTDHWLSDAKNVLTIRLSEPAWEAPGPSQPLIADPMATWEVGAVASWLESMDMSGPAAVLKSQGVNGADLTAFSSPAEFARDLGTTTFVSRKVLYLRDSFLQSHA